MTRQDPEQDARPVRVLVSFPPPRPTTNPYITQLASALEATDGVEVRYFGFREALLGRYDVFHVHWPEILGAGQSPLKALARQALTALFLARLALTRTAVVRTVHNLERPSGISRREQALLTAFERATTLRIRVNDVTPMPAGAPFETIVHGHYRDWFAGYPRTAPIAGRLAYFGLIRRYKGVEDLIALFHALAEPELSLVVAGKPSTDELAAVLTEAAAGDPRIELDLRFLADADLVATVTAAQLVVLPYRFMHNSGATLTALSLDRPVLVPDTEVNRRLAAEVGPGWVTTYPDDLTAADLIAAARAAATADRAPEPDLSRRGWADAGRSHLAAYRRAIAVRRGGRRAAAAAASEPRR